MNKQKVEIPLTTLPFFKYEKDGIVYYEFDATECSPPEPMVNTMNALTILKDKKERLVGKFFHEPTPLYDKISKYFSHTAQELEDGSFLITFAKL
ncbi:DUF2249 domain-containing protein [Sulfurimonas sp.]